MMITQNKLKQLRRYFQKQSAVIAVYLYGSQVRGTSNRLSDIDIAVMLSRFTPQTHQLHLQLIGDISQVFQSDAVDVQMLSPQTAPALAIRMLKGRLIFCRDARIKTRLTAEILSRYQDFQPFLKYQIIQMEKRLREGTYAGG